MVKHRYIVYGVFIMDSLPGGNYFESTCNSTGDIIKLIEYYRSKGMSVSTVIRDKQVPRDSVFDDVSDLRFTRSASFPLDPVIDLNE